MGSGIPEVADVAQAQGKGGHRMKPGVEVAGAGRWGMFRFGALGCVDLFVCEHKELHYTTAQGVGVG